MASTHKHLRSSTANKRPTTAIADGQIALNTNTTSPGLFFKDSTGATIIKVGPVHVSATAPNVSPPAGGSAGNSIGEVWLDTSLTPPGVKIYNGAAFVNATPIGSTTVQGLLELATSAETQAGSDTDRAVTPAGLQSKLSDSISTTSSTTIASSTAVKSAYDLANAALPKSGGIITGNLEIGTTGSLSFEGATGDGFETTIAVTDPTADRTITLPDTTGTIVTTGDTGTVTSTMIADGTIMNSDINSAAAIAHSKLASLTAGNILLGNASNVPTSTAVTGDITISNAGVTAISANVIVNADINSSAAIAGTKVSPDFGSQNVITTGTVTGASLSPTSSTVPSNGVYLPAANSVAISTGGSGRLFINSSGSVLVGTSSAIDDSLAQIALRASIHRLNSDAFAPTFRFDKRRGSSSVIASDTVGSIEFRGSDGTNFLSAASINAVIDGTPGANDMPGRLVFSTTADGASSPTERMRIDSSGRLLVGTSSSTADAIAVFLGRTGAPGGTGGEIKLAHPTTNVPASGTLGRIQFGNTSDDRGAEIAATANQTWTSTAKGSYLTFSTTANNASSPTERMRIGNSGIVDIGSGGVGGNLRAMVVSGSAMQLSNTNTATTNLPFIEFGRSATGPSLYTAEGDIRTDGSGNLAFNNASDITLKENIRDLPDCLASVTQLRPVLFDWKEEHKPCCTDIKGFIAQEFEQILPKSVNTDENGIKSISPVTELLPLLVGAIKELSAQVNELQAEVAAIKA